MAYLGSWRTHPEFDPTPSSVDRIDWAQAVSQDRYEGDCLFFLIVGTKKIRGWMLARDGTYKELETTGPQQVQRLTERGSSA